MEIVTGILLYVMIWWTVLFAVLPWKATPSNDPLVGNSLSAPENPRIATKFLITTVIAFVIWGAVYSLIQTEWISFRRVVL